MVILQLLQTLNIPGTLCWQDSKKLSCRNLECLCGWNFRVFLTVFRWITHFTSILNCSMQCWKFAWKKFLLKKIAPLKVKTMVLQHIFMTLHTFAWKGVLRKHPIPIWIFIHRKQCCVFENHYTWYVFIALLKKMFFHAFQQFFQLLWLVKIFF